MSEIQTSNTTIFFHKYCFYKYELKNTYFKIHQFFFIGQEQNDIKKSSAQISWNPTLI